jgi:biotin transporter BioY
LWFAVTAGLSLRNAAAVGLDPFLARDAVNIVVAAGLLPAARAVVPHANLRQAFNTALSLGLEIATDCEQ